VFLIANADGQALDQAQCQALETELRRRLDPR